MTVAVPLRFGPASVILVPTIVIATMLGAMVTSARAHQRTLLTMEARGVVDFPIEDFRYDAPVGWGGRLALVWRSNKWETGGLGFLEALETAECVADAPCTPGPHRLGGGGVLLRRRIGDGSGSRPAIELGAGYADRWWKDAHSSGAFVSAGMNWNSTKSFSFLNSFGVGLLALPRSEETGIYLNVSVGRSFRLLSQTTSHQPVVPVKDPQLGSRDQGNQFETAAASLDDDL